MIQPLTAKYLQNFGHYTMVLMWVMGKNGLILEFWTFDTSGTPYRGSNEEDGHGHENVLRLIGVALDLPPFLALMEFCEAGDLKSFLRNSKGM